MSGRLPMRYQLMTWVVGLVVCAGAGAWLAWSTSLPVVWTSGALAGAVLGVALVAAFVRGLGTVPHEAPAPR